MVESFGLAGFGYHARDEYIEIDSIVPRLYLVTRLLAELGKQPWATRRKAPSQGAFDPGQCGGQW